MKKLIFVVVVFILLMSGETKSWDGNCGEYFPLFEYVLGDCALLPLLYDSPGGCGIFTNQNFIQPRCITNFIPDEWGSYGGAKLYWKWPLDVPLLPTEGNRCLLLTTEEWPEPLSEEWPFSQNGVYTLVWIGVDTRIRFDFFFGTVEYLDCDVATASLIPVFPREQDNVIIEVFRMSDGDVGRKSSTEGWQEWDWRCTDPEQAGWYWLEFKIEEGVDPYYGTWFLLDKVCVAGLEPDFSNPYTADVNRDGVVNFIDYSFLVQANNLNWMMEFVQYWLE